VFIRISPGLKAANPPSRGYYFKADIDLVALIGHYALAAALPAGFDMQLGPAQPPLLPVDEP
jgi:hypothetical protein